MLILHLLLPFPSSRLVIAPFPSLLGHPPIHSQCLLAALSFLPPQMLWLPFVLVPCPCWLLSCGMEASHAQFWPASAPCHSPSICEHMQYSQKSCQMVPKDLSKPGRKEKQNWGVLVPLCMILETPLVCLPEKLLQGKISCSFSWEWKWTAIYNWTCFQASHVCYAGLQLLF